MLETADQLGEGRRGASRAHRIGGVVSHPARRESASPAGGGQVRRRPVHGQKVKGDGIAGLQGPAANIVGVAMGVEIRDRLVIGIGADIVLAAAGESRYGYADVT